MTSYFSKYNSKRFSEKSIACIASKKPRKTALPLHLTRPSSLSITLMKPAPHWPAVSTIFKKGKNNQSAILNWFSEQAWLEYNSGMQILNARFVARILIKFLIRIPSYQVVKKHLQLLVLVTTSILRSDFSVMKILLFICNAWNYTNFTFLSRRQFNL